MVAEKKVGKLNPYESYTGRNPKTKVQVQIPAKRLPSFKCGKELREMVAQKNNKRKNSQIRRIV
ncbi:MAG: HU family DNA-binding protein [Desulfamplus sp.]|nr:HU family DNA-binding protein [Desulfamplus sp.]